MQTVLSDVERRVVANLSIPRNVADLTGELRRDPYFPSTSEEEVHGFLTDLEKHGLVVNIGDGAAQTPGELAAKVDAHKTAVSMPDEKAQIFEQRLQLPHRSWRLEGDVWMFTEDGRDMLWAPPAGAGSPLDVMGLSALIQNEWKRVDTDLNPKKLPEGVTLGDKLTTDEFGRWHEAVVKDWMKRNGVSKRPAALSPPIAGGAGYADATENLIVDAENAKTGYTVSTQWYMALVKTAVTDADTGSTIAEPNTTTEWVGYARKSVAAADMNAASAGSASNANAIIFAAHGGGSGVSIIGFAKCIAATVGTLQKYGTCSTVTVSATQTPAQFAVGAFTTSLD